MSGLIALCISLTAGEPLKHRVVATVGISREGDKARIWIELKNTTRNVVNIFDINAIPDKNIFCAMTVRGKRGVILKSTIFAPPLPPPPEGKNENIPKLHKLQLSPGEIARFEIDSISIKGVNVKHLNIEVLLNDYNYRSYLESNGVDVENIYKMALVIKNRVEL